MKAVELTMSQEGCCCKISISLINHMTPSGMTSWKAVGVVVEGQPVRIRDVNVWEYTWTQLNEPSVELPHPSYPSQLHSMSVYEIKAGGGRIRFAAGELSANVWGFYVPE
jgi:hypothetical protein